MTVAVLSTDQGAFLKSSPIVIAAAFLAASIANPAYAEAPSSATQPRNVNVERAEHPDLVALRKQMAEHPKLPPMDFWLAVARCETAHGVAGKIQWSRGAHWRKTTVTGALGIADSAWRGYRGTDYAPRAGLASMYAQIIVANRIGFLGAQTNEYLTLADKLANKPFYRPAAGFSQGWGGTCRKSWISQHKRGN